MLDFLYMNKDKALESVEEIKKMMERSSKFTSCSGLAIILAGVFALIGAYTFTKLVTPETKFVITEWTVAIIAAIVLIASINIVCIFSYYKAQKAGVRFFSRITYRALWAFLLPMITGGFLCLAAFMHQYYDIISSITLLLYGLALFNVSKYSYSSLSWMGYAFILLGVLDCFWQGHSLLCWSIGFGGFHIAYGLYFYLHHEKSIL